MVIFIVSHRSGCLREETSPFQNEYVARWKRTWGVRALLWELGPTDLQLKARHFQPDGACRRIQARICSSHCQNHRRQDQKGMRELAKKPISELTFCVETRGHGQICSRTTKGTFSSLFHLQFQLGPSNLRHLPFKYFASDQTYFFEFNYWLTCFKLTWVCILAYKYKWTVDPN